MTSGRLGFALTGQIDRLFGRTLGAALARARSHREAPAELAPGRRFRVEESRECGGQRSFDDPVTGDMLPLF